MTNLESIIYNKDLKVGDRFQKIIDLVQDGPLNSFERYTIEDYLGEMKQYSPNNLKEKSSEYMREASSNYSELRNLVKEKSSNENEIPPNLLKILRGQEEGTWKLIPRIIDLYTFINLNSKTLDKNTIKYVYNVIKQKVPKLDGHKKNFIENFLQNLHKTYLSDNDTNKETINKTKLVLNDSGKSLSGGIYNNASFNLENLEMNYSRNNLNSWDINNNNFNSLDYNFPQAQTILRNNVKLKMPFNLDEFSSLNEMNNKKDLGRGYSFKGIPQKVLDSMDSKPKRNFEDRKKFPDFDATQTKLITDVTNPVTGERYSRNDFSLIQRTRGLLSEKYQKAMENSIDALNEGVDYSYLANYYKVPLPPPKKVGYAKRANTLFNVLKDSNTARRNQRNIYNKSLALGEDIR